MLEMDLIKEKFLSATSGPIGFRLLSRVDCYPLLDACANEEFNKHLAWDAVQDPAILMEKIDSLIREMQIGRSISFSVVEKTTGTWIGISKWTPYKDSYMITIWSHPTFWKTGLPIHYIFTSHRLIFDALNIPHVYAVTKKTHTTILRILQKLKAQYIQDVPYEHESGEILECLEYKIFNHLVEPTKEIVLL